MASAYKLEAVPPVNRAAIEPADILTPGQVAERLQVDVESVRRWSRTKGLPALKCGRYLRFAWPDVCAWMRKGKSS